MLRIAIDGPSGAGKSSVAKSVAKKLGIIYVDTGALYRTIGLYMLNHGIDTKDRDAVVSRLNDFKLELTFVDGNQVILLDGSDVGDNIRTPEVSMAASNVSAITEVREFLLKTQQDIADKNSVIMDGRDIGTVIIPNAEIKIFLTASIDSRAKRRFEELKAKGQEVSFDKVYTEMLERDKNDSSRDIAPCKKADDAILLDNSSLTAEQTTEKVLKIVKRYKKKNRNFYMKAYSVLAAPIRFFQRIKPIGLENIPAEKGFIICSNHIAAKDVVMIAVSYPRQIRFIGKKELFSVPLLGWIIKKLGAISLDRSGGNVNALKASIEIAKQGESIAIFPQGHRYPGVDPSTTDIKTGAGFIAYHSGADILPVCIKTKNSKYTLFGRIQVIFGKPIRNSELGFDKGGSDEYTLATRRIFNEVLRLGGYNSLPELGEGDKS